MLTDKNTYNGGYIKAMAELNNRTSFEIAKSLSLLFSEITSYHERTIG